MNSQNSSSRSWTNDAQNDGSDPPAHSKSQPDLKQIPSEEPGQHPAPRRSGRNRKSTTLIVDGHVVLTQNNYVLKGGSYQFGAHKADVPNGKRKTPPTTKELTTKVNKTRRKNNSEQKRSCFNENLKRNVAKKLALRQSFLSKHLEVLEPFLESTVTRKLSAFEKVFPKDHTLFIQPEAIQADLRDYQLAGLNWMVEMYRQNVSCILGDEMVCALKILTITLFQT